MLNKHPLTEGFASFLFLLALDNVDRPPPHAELVNAVAMETIIH